MQALRFRIVPLVSIPLSVYSLVNFHNLRFSTEHRNKIAHRFTNHGTCERRDMRNRASGRIGFVLADDTKRLRTPILTPHEDACSEMHVGAIRWTLHELCRRTASRPVAKLALHGRNDSLVMLIDRRSICCTETIDSSFNRGEPFGRDKVRMGGDRPITEIGWSIVGFFDKGAAHVRP